MKLTEAQYHNREAHLLKLIEYANDPDYIVKLRHYYDGTIKLVESVHYMNQKEIDKWHSEDENQEPFISVQFYGFEDVDIYDPGEFAQQAQVFELKKIL